MAKKKSRPVAETVAAIHAHLAEVFPGYQAPSPASADDLQLLADAAGAPLPDDLVELYRATDGISPPEDVPDTITILTARDAREQTAQARGEHADVQLVILEHQDYESSVRALALSGETSGQLTRWDSVEGHYDDYEDTTIADFLASYLKTLQEALPTPKQLKAAVAKVAKAGRAGDLQAVYDLFERSGRPGYLLRAVLESCPDAPSWIAPSYGSSVLDRPLHQYSSDLPVSQMMAVAASLAFPGTVTLLAGMSPLMHTLMAYAYQRDPDEATKAAANLTGIAKDSWLLLQRRIGTIPVSAIPDELRTRLAASPRKYRVYTPREGRMVESTAEGLAGLDPYFESRDQVVAAIRNAPLSSCASPDIVQLHLENATTPERLAAIFDASVAEYAGVDDSEWHRIPLRRLVDAAKLASEGDQLAWICVGHPDANPEVLQELAPVMKMPEDPEELDRLPPGLAAAIKRKSA